MILEAKSPSCFSDQYLLKLNGHPHGEFQGRWFSEGIDVRLTSRGHMHLEKSSWLGSHFTLTGSNKAPVLAQADRRGLFTTAWDMNLSIGPANLVSAGLFNTGFIVLQSGQTIAKVNRVGLCDRSWYVEDNGTLNEADLLFIGLIYHTILKRAARRSSS